MTDRYDLEHDRVLKRDRDPRSTRSNDYPDRQQYGEPRQQWVSGNGDDDRYASSSQYRQGYGNRDTMRGWRNSERDHDYGDDSRTRQAGGYRGSYGSVTQTGDYFGPGDFGSGSHAYAANWDRGYGPSRNADADERWQAGYGSGQASQRDTRIGQMGGSGYQPGERYARDDVHRGFLDRAADEVMSWWGDEDAARRREQDHREDHRGRGPADYTRSDERIREDANDRLTDDWRVDARRVSVAVESGEVTLTGTVPSRQEKHRAEECVERISGVRHVQNNLRVEGTGVPSQSGVIATGEAADRSTEESRMVESSGSLDNGAMGTAQRD